MNDDNLLYNLVELAVLDSARKELYHDSIPRMTGDEKLRFTVKLWEMWMSQLDLKVRRRAEDMVAEMATNDSVEYRREDFDRIKIDMIDKMLHDQVGMEETAQMDAMRDQLAMIQDLVESHAQEIESIKSKID